MNLNSLFKADFLTSANRSQLLVISLLLAAIDVVLFYVLNQPVHSLASAHLASFLCASIAGLIALKIKPKQLLTFVLITLLVVLLRGGLLESLVSIMPALAAMCICALFSAVMLIFGYQYMQFINTNADTKWKYWCIAVLIYLTLLKLFYLGASELIFEEAYYWNYAQHLDIGYLDHPLMVAWIIKAFTFVLGDNEFTVRIGAFLCWFITARYVFKLTRETLNEASAYWALVLLAALPAYFSFGWFMTPDAPLTACWAAAIYYFHQVIVKGNAEAWYGVGIALGLGMISKYTIALLGGAMFLFLLIDKDSRKWLLRPQPYIALLIVCALFSPVIIWNMQHAWASLLFQSEGRVASGHHFSLPRFISNVLIFITPFGVMSVIAVVQYKKIILTRLQASIDGANSINRSYFVLAWITLFPIAVYATLSVFRASKLNWTGPCWLGFLPFLALLISQKADKSTPKLLAWSARAWPATVVILMLIYGAGLHYLSLGLPLANYPQNTHLMGYAGFGAEVETLVTQLEKERHEQILVVAMDRNKIASGLAFYRNKISPENKPALSTASGHLFGVGALMYEFWFPTAQQNGKTMLLIGEKSDELSDASLLSRATPIGEIKTITTHKNGKQTGTYYTRLVSNYRGQASKLPTDDAGSD
ncbi:MAG: glycosyltransferase family 39 protein [Bdellovibrio sp.]|nr:glycosyltransferase family 39 protein [Methylotenera sp.]